MSAGGHTALGEQRLVYGQSGACSWCQQDVYVPQALGSLNHVNFGT